MKDHRHQYAVVMLCNSLITLSITNITLHSADKTILCSAYHVFSSGKKERLTQAIETKSMEQSPS